MAVPSLNRDLKSKLDAVNPCCEQWRKKYSNGLESRKALRQAIKLLEGKIDELQTQNKRVCVARNETGGKLEQLDAKVSLENEPCSSKSEINTPKIEQGCGSEARGGGENDKVIQGLQACVAEREKEICRLKELLEVEKRRADSVGEREKEICRLKELLEVEKRRADSVGEREKEICRLKELLEMEKRRADSVGEREKEICRLKELLEIEKRRTDSKEEKEKEIRRLKELLETEKRRADSVGEREKEICRLKELLETEKRKADSVGERKKEICRLKELLETEKRRADSEAEREKEICRLKELLETEKRRAGSEGKWEKEICRFKELVETEKRKADSEGKRAAEAWKLVNEEKKKTAEKGMQIAVIEAKAEEYKVQIGRLEKQVNEVKTKFASEISTLKDAATRFEAEKRKMLAEKRTAESGLAIANKKLEVEKNKAAEGKKRADAEIVKLEEQKARAEENWNKFMEEKRLSDKMSQQLEEDKKIIKDLKQKMHELSSLRKPVEMAADIDVKAETTKVKLLKKALKLEKLRVKHAKQKCKLEASRYNILRHDLGHVKNDFTRVLHRLDMLDASVPPVAGSIHDQTKSELYLQNSNVTRTTCNLNLEPCCTTIGACDPLRKNMQHIPLFALSGGNYSESLTGIDSKLEPLVRGSNKPKLPSSAVLSSTESYSDAQLMGPQGITAFPVTASTKLTQEIFNARQSMCDPSDRPVGMQKRKRKRMHDTADCDAKLSSENLSDLQALFCREVDKCLEGGKNGRAHKTRKKSCGEIIDMILQINREEKKGRETTQACEMVYDAANNFDSVVSFDQVADGSYMKLLELENAAYEECYKRAMDFPMSPSLPEIEFHETFDTENLVNPFSEEALQENMLSSRTDLIPSPYFDVINLEINSNEQNLDVSGVSTNSQKTSQATKPEVIKLPHMHTPENSRTEFLRHDGVRSSQIQLPKLCVFSNIEDSSIISRILIATKNCIARCNLATQTTWAVSNILTALKMEGKLSQKEKVSVLLTLLLFNLMVTTTTTFGKLWDGNLFHCLNSYGEHIRTAMSDTETRIMFLENYSLHELLGLIEEFLIEGKVILSDVAETSSDSDLRKNDVMNGVDKVSSNVASSEQLIAGSIILASLCAATDHVAFTCEASYNILRLCTWDPLMVLTILHIFAYLGGEKFFDSDHFCLMVTVLKSLVKFLEGEISSVVSTVRLPSINQLHPEFRTKVKCPFLEGAESIDAVACLLLEEIKDGWLQGINRVELADSRYSCNARQWSIREVAECANDKNNDAPYCLKKCLISASQPDAALKNINFCHLSDVLSLVELVANKMGWHWTDIKFVPQLLNMLDSCAEEKIAIAIIVLLGQLGRIGVDVSGYEDGGVQNLRSNLFAYLCRSPSSKAGISLQIATATTLLGLLPLDPETLSQTNISIGACSKSVSDNAETLRKWFSGLGKDQQVLVSGVLKCNYVYNK